MKYAPYVRSDVKSFPWYPSLFYRPHVILSLPTKALPTFTPRSATSIHSLAEQAPADRRSMRCAHPHLWRISRAEADNVPWPFNLNWKWSNCLPCRRGRLECFYFPDKASSGLSVERVWRCDSSEQPASAGVWIPAMLSDHFTASRIDGREVNSASVSHRSRPI